MSPSRSLATCFLVLTPLALIWPAAGCASRSGATPATPATVAAPADTPPAAPSSPGTTSSATAAATGATGAMTGTLPKVRLVATGGTISNRPGSRLTAEELITSIPEVTRHARIEAEQFANVASSEMTLAQWLGLARRLNALLRSDPDLAGLVVTSGTDTLEELAYFLHLTVRDARPVVVVGSMRRPGVPGYEGQANLIDAFRVAADPGARGKGALVVLNDEILSAREATKTDAQRLHTFQTRNYGVLGVVDVDQVTWYRDLVKRHSAKSEFDVETITALPRVDVLLMYQGATGDLVRAAVDAGAKGIVFATAAGATSSSQGEGARYASEKQVVVVRTTRTGAGRIMGGGATIGTGGSAPAGTGGTGAAGGTPTGASGSGGPGAGGAAARTRSIAGEDLAPIKARILLMLALTRTSSLDEIQRMFLEY